MNQKKEASSGSWEDHHSETRRTWSLGNWSHQSEKLLGEAQLVRADVLSQVLEWGFGVCGGEGE